MGREEDVIAEFLHEYCVLEDSGKELPSEKAMCIGWRIVQYEVMEPVG